MPATVLDGFELAHFSRTGSGMAMQMDRQLNGFYHSGHKFCCYHRCQQSGHVLYDDTVAVHVGQLTRHGHEFVNTVYRAGGIADGALGMFAGLFYAVDCRFQIAYVIKGIENTKNIDAVVRRFPHKVRYHVIGIVAITKQILSAQ
jgi:hypothetical protein